MQRPRRMHPRLRIVGRQPTTTKLRTPTSMPPPRRPRDRVLRQARSIERISTHHVLIVTWTKQTMPNNNHDACGRFASGASGAAAEANKTDTDAISSQQKSANRLRNEAINQAIIRADNATSAANFSDSRAAHVQAAAAHRKVSNAYLFGVHPDGASSARDWAQRHEVIAKEHDFRAKFSSHQ